MPSQPVCRARRGAALGLLVLIVLVFLGCSDSPNAPSADPQDGTGAPLAQSRLEMRGQILGPAEHDDDADLRITIVESEGVAATLNFVRLTCSNNVEVEWGASSFLEEWGANVISGGATVVFVRHYRCPVSARPRLILADLTDANGFHHVITAAPFHPDWP